MMLARASALAVLAVALVTGLLSGDDLLAQQVPYDSACRTNAGICPINPAPINSACRCFNDPGRVVAHPVNWRNVCRTSTTQCGTAFAPVGAPCRCGNLPGRIIN